MKPNSPAIKSVKARAVDAPISRPVEPPAAGKVVALPRAGGLHHRYARAA